MTEYILNTFGGLLASEVIETGNVQKYTLDGQFVLDPGVVWETASVDITDGVAATVDIGGASHDLKSFWVMVTAPVEGEKFTVTVTSETTDQQVWVYTIDFLVVT